LDIRISKLGNATICGHKYNVRDSIYTLGILRTIYFKFVLTKTSRLNRAIQHRLWASQQLPTPWAMSLNRQKGLQPLQLKQQLSKSYRRKMILLILSPNNNCIVSICWDCVLSKSGDRYLLFISNIHGFWMANRSNREIVISTQPVNLNYVTAFYTSKELTKWSLQCGWRRNICIFRNRKKFRVPTIIV
jgi:hypothetical protein